jgi:hypothetical protein
MIWKIFLRLNCFPDGEYFHTYNIPTPVKYAGYGVYVYIVISVLLTLYSFGEVDKTLDILYLVWMGVLAIDIFSIRNGRRALCCNCQFISLERKYCVIVVSKLSLRFAKLVAICYAAGYISEGGEMTTTIILQIIINFYNPIEDICAILLLVWFVIFLITAAVMLPFLILGAMCGYERQGMPKWLSKLLFRFQKIRIANKQGDNIDGYTLGLDDESHIGMKSVASRSKV